MESRFLPHIALLVVAVIYGLNFVIAKNVMIAGYLEPFPFILLRVAGGTIMFWVAYLLFVKEFIQWRDIPYLIMCAFFGVAVNQLSFFAGLKLTSPVHASLLMTIVPILVLMVSAIILSESISARKILGIALGMGGAVYLISSGENLHFAGSIIKGDLLVMINVVSYSLYIVLVKRLLTKYHPITVVTWLFTVGLFMVLPFGYKGLNTAAWNTFGSEIWLSIGYVIIGTTFLAYLFNAYAISKVNPSIVSIYIYLQPIVASVASVIFYNEALGIDKLISAMLIFGGVYFVSIPSQKVRISHLCK